MTERNKDRDRETEEKEIDRINDIAITAYLYKLVVE